jgi:hypothetical protein
MNETQRFYTHENSEDALVRADSEVVPTESLVAPLVVAEIVCLLELSPPTSVPGVGKLKLVGFGEARETVVVVAA